MASSEENDVLFEEDFTVIDVNCDSSVGEKVNRIHCEGQSTSSDLILDVYSPLFKVSAGESIEVKLVKDPSDCYESPQEVNQEKEKESKEDEDENADFFGSTEKMDTEEPERPSPRQVKVKESIDPLDSSEVLNKYPYHEYVVYGKIYQIEEKMIDQSPCIAVYASFGGLLFRLQILNGPVSVWHIDYGIYLLVKKHVIDPRSSVPTKPEEPSPEDPSPESPGKPESSDQQEITDRPKSSDESESSDQSDSSTRSESPVKSKSPSRSPRKIFKHHVHPKPEPESS